MANSQARDQWRARRFRAVRSHSLSAKRASKRQLAVLGAEIETPEHDRPRTRGECKGGARPCPFVSCRWHLYLDVSPRTGSLKLNFPDVEPERMLDSCALDIADLGGRSHDVVAAIMNITRARVQQIEVAAMAKVGPHLTATDPEEFGGEPGPNGRVLVAAIDAEHQMRFGEEETAA